MFEYFTYKSLCLNTLKIIPSKVLILIYRDLGGAGGTPSNFKNNQTGKSDNYWLTRLFFFEKNIGSTRVPPAVSPSYKSTYLPELPPVDALSVEPKASAVFFPAKRTSETVALPPL